jgi:hypothetical protein
MATILEKTAGLLAFVRTIDAGSFAGAARLIGASPSAVSKSVARLEERLGVRLLTEPSRAGFPQKCEPPSSVVSSRRRYHRQHLLSRRQRLQRRRQRLWSPRHRLRFQSSAN